MESIHSEPEIWFAHIENNCDVDPLSFHAIKEEPISSTSIINEEQSEACPNLNKLTENRTTQSLDSVEDTSEYAKDSLLAVDFLSSAETVFTLPPESTTRGIKRKHSDVSSYANSNLSELGLVIETEPLTDPVTSSPILEHSNNATEQIYSQKFVRYGLAKFCPSCQIFCKDQFDMACHRTLHGNGGTPVKLCLPTSCMVQNCNEKFINFCSLAVHNQVIHEHRRVKNPLVKTTTDMKFFKCPICFAFFQTEKLFLTHIQPHTLIIEIPCSCIKCVTQFSKFEHINEHYLKNHNDNLPYKCKICESGFSTLQRLLKHGKHHYKSVVFCRYCKTELNLSEILSKKHFKNCLSSKKHCILCEKPCKEIRDHLNSHDLRVTYQFVCILCFKTFQTNRHLSFHQCTQHFSISLPAAAFISIFFKYKKRSKNFQRNTNSNLYFTCSSCKEEFETSVSAMQHFHEIHSKPIFYQCMECRKILIKNDNEMRNHYEYHYGTSNKQIGNLLDTLFNRIEFTSENCDQSNVVGNNTMGKSKPKKSKSRKSSKSKVSDNNGKTETHASQHIVLACSNNETQRDSSDDDLEILEPNSEIITTSIQESIPKVIANVHKPLEKSKVLQSSSFNSDFEDNDIMIIDEVNSNKSVTESTKTKFENSQTFYTKNVVHSPEPSENNTICKPSSFEIEKHDVSTVECNSNIVENSETIFKEMCSVPSPAVSDNSESALVINEFDDDDDCDIVEIYSNLSPPGYVCNTCKFNFENQSDLSKHSFIHYETKKFNSFHLCDRAFCKLGFNNFCSFKIHFKSTHERMQIKNPVIKTETTILYKCEICLAVFDDSKSLLNHCPNYKEFASDCK